MNPVPERNSENYRSLQIEQEKVSVQSVFTSGGLFVRSLCAFRDLTFVFVQDRMMYE